MAFPEAERVVLDIGNGRYETFSVSYLLGKSLVLPIKINTSERV